MHRLHSLSALLISLFALTSLSLAQSPHGAIRWQAADSAAGNLHVYLVTFSPGDELTDWFGHTAIVVRDSIKKISKLYNFGLFSFNEGFIENFIFGRLIFWKGRHDLASTLVYYKSERRSIYFHELNLEALGKLQLARALEEEVRPGNRRYLYDHYRDNCATRLRDLIDRAIHGQLKEATQTSDGRSYRDLTMQYTDDHPLMQWLLLFLMNNTIDRPLTHWEEMFLPDYLERYVRETRYTDSRGKERELVGKSWTEFDAGRPPVPPADTISRYPLWPLGAGLLWAALILFSAWNARRSQLLLRFSGLLLFLGPFVMGLIGTILFFMAFFTDHTVTWHNENLMLLHPLMLLTSFAALGCFLKKQPASCWSRLEVFWLVQSILGVLLLVAKVFPMFDQQNYMALAFCLPFIWGNFIALKLINRS